VATPNPAFYDAPAVNPAGLGLYTAATLLDVPLPTTSTPADERIGFGLLIRPINCAAGAGTWPANPCAAAPGGGVRKEGDRAETPEVFLPVEVWGYDECGPREFGPKIADRALQNLKLQEPLLVESAFATRLLADAPAPTVVPDIVAAVSALEELLGDAGFLGVIHASRRFAARAESAHLIIRSGGSGGILRTPLGHTWAFGGGYADVLEDTLVATGPVTVKREPIVQIDGLDPNTNLKFSLAERKIVDGYECHISAVTVDPTP
jgi:hypothetical protein